MCANRLLLSGLVLSVGTAVAAPYRFTITCDEPSRMRKVGETTSFRVVCEDLATTNRHGGPVEVWLDDFGTNVLVRQTVVPSSADPIVLSGTLTAPGFLRVMAKNPDVPQGFFGVGKGNACASVGYEPTKIVQGLACPDDFDAYWQGERRRLAREVPPDVRRERAPDFKKKGFACWKVSFATFGGKRIWGFLTVPDDGTEGPWPLRVNVPGAGPAAVASSAMTHPGEVSLTLNVHPFEPAATAEGQKKLYEVQDNACRKRYGTTYATAGIAVSREDYFFHDIILGMDRAVDWAVALPETDRTHVWYTGGSQGGGFGMYLMGLNKSFTRGYVWICALTDLGGYRAGRISGWPRLVECNKKGHAVAERFAPYFDACNFAARVRIPLRMSAGLSDTCCPPPAVWSAYNALGSVDKAIVPCPNVGHSIPSDVQAVFERWLTSGGVPDTWRVPEIAGVGFRGLLGNPGVSFDAPRYAEMMKLPYFSESAWTFALSKKSNATAYRKASDWPKHYAEPIPEAERPKSPYRMTDLFGRPEALEGDIDRPFLVGADESRPAYRLGGGGFPLADRAHYADWKRRHPNFLGFQSLDEFDSDTTYYIRYYDRLGAPSADIRRRYPMPPSGTGVGSWEWMKTALGDTADFCFGEKAMTWGLFSNFASFCNMSAALGARGIFYEATSQSYASWQVAGAYVRGAARQFGLPTTWYIAHYIEGYTRDGKEVNGENCYNPEICRRVATARREGGASRTLLQRQALYGWLIGSNLMQTEHWVWLYAEEKAENRCGGDVKVLWPTREAYDINGLYLLSKNVDRGVTYAPLAILTPVDEPMATSGDSQHLRDRFGQHAAFNTLVPLKLRGEGHRKAGYQGCLYNSPFADFYDVLVPDAGQDRAAFLKALSAYRHAFLAGGGFKRETIDAEALATWVREGGTLYASADQVRAGVVPSGLAGVRFAAETRPAGASFMDETGKTRPLHGTYRVRTATSEGATPFARTAGGDILAWTRTSGKGRIVTVAVDRLLPIGFEDEPRFDDNAYLFNRFVPINRGEYAFDLHQWIFSRIQDETMPVAVHGDVQWGMNMVEVKGRNLNLPSQPSQWLLYLFNNKGVVKFIDEPEILDEAKTAHVTVDLRDLVGAVVTDAVSGRSLHVTDDKVTVDVPPGGSRLLTLCK